MMVLELYSSQADRALRDLFSQNSFPLYRLMGYQLGWLDEAGLELPSQVAQTRLHASLALAACEAVGGSIDRAAPAGVAVEMLNQFVQVHSDIQDGIPERNGRDTLWWVWGPAQAINAGDGFHALARLSLMQLLDGRMPPHEILDMVNILDKASLRMLEGMHQDMVYQERVDILPEAYLEMAREKVGALIGAALEMGALCGGASKEQGRAFREFGEEIGVAFQIQEDIQMLWGQPISGRPKGADVLNKKKGYPVLFTLDQAEISIKRDLGTLFFKRVLEPPDLEHLVAVLDGLKARDVALTKVRELYSHAVAGLEESGSADVENLRSIAAWLALRE